MKRLLLVLLLAASAFALTYGAQCFYRPCARCAVEFNDTTGEPLLEPMAGLAAYEWNGGEWVYYGETAADGWFRYDVSCNDTREFTIWDNDTPAYSVRHFENCSQVGGYLGPEVAVLTDGRGYQCWTITIQEMPNYTRPTLEELLNQTTSTVTGTVEIKNGSYREFPSIPPAPPEKGPYVAPDMSQAPTPQPEGIFEGYGSATPSGQAEYERNIAAIEAQDAAEEKARFDAALANLSPTRMYSMRPDEFAWYQTQAVAFNKTVPWLSSMEAMRAHALELQPNLSAAPTHSPATTDLLIDSLARNQQPSPAPQPASFDFIGLLMELLFGWLH